jgi:NAD/NADP transhydrogenase beta subunit
MFMILVVLSVLVIGLLAFSGRLFRFGRLPGDIQYKGTRTRIYAPITSMLLLSLLLSLVLTLLSWFF